MSTEEPPKTLPPFIASHQLKRLTITREQRRTVRDLLRGGRDVRDEMPSNGENGGEIGVPIKESHWKEINRFEYFSQMNYPRIAITVDGGFGKSIALRQFRFVRQQLHPDHLVLLCDLADLPMDPWRFIDESEEYCTQSFIVGLLNAYLKTPVKCHDREWWGQSMNLEPNQIEDWLRVLMSRGLITLMIDGMDQAEAVKAGDRIEALVQFLKWYPKVHCVVAGRPTSIEDHFDLFASDADGLGSEWDFLLVPEFSKDHVAEYIGPRRAERLRELGADSLFVPRTLELIRTMPDDEFAKCHSAADVYWRSVQRTLKIDIGKQNAARSHKLNELQILDIFAAVAYVLTSWESKRLNPTTGILEAIAQPINQIESESDYEKMATQLIECMKQIPRLGLSSIDPIHQYQFVEDRLSELSTINASLVDFAFWDGHNVRRLQWRNPTLRDFLAAYWLSNFASASQQSWMKDHMAFLVSKEDRGLDFEISENIYWYACWRFICDIPIELRKWEAPTGYWELIASLFLQRMGRRPTELAYHAWPGLLHRAGFLPAMTTDEIEVQAATGRAQSWARQCHIGDEQSTGTNAARKILLNFLREYLDLVHAKNPEVLMLEKSLSASKVKLVPRGPFLYGDHLQERHIPVPFRMSAYQVWNDLYSLFDPNHNTHFHSYDRYSPYGRGACIYKTWHDSWMFSVWSHSRLPSEFEWEAACRARVGDLNFFDHGKFCFGDDEAKLGEYAWFYENCCESEDHAKRGFHVHSVGQKQANAYGLYDVHGNVWEWTSNWYDQDRECRCVRGGSFYDYAHNARCSTRNRYFPYVADCFSGFRVVRTAF
jgi:Sulfatase-modifying factor enzyme 1